MEKKVSILFSDNYVIDQITLKKQYLLLTTLKLSILINIKTLSLHIQLQNNLFFKMVSR